MFNYSFKQRWETLLLYKQDKNFTLIVLIPGNKRYRPEAMILNSVTLQRDKHKTQN